MSEILNFLYSLEKPLILREIAESADSLLTSIPPTLMNIQLRKLALSALSMALPVLGMNAATVAYYNFDSTFASSDSEPNSIASDVTSGGGFSPSTPVFSNTAVSGQSLAPQGIIGQNETEAINGDYYLEFTVTPDSGFELDLSNLSVYLQRSSDGSASDWFVRSSLDGYSSNIDSVQPTQDFELYDIDLSAAAYQNITSGVTFRLYAYGGNPSGSSASLRHDNLSLSGEVTSIPEPAAIGFFIGGMALALAGLKRRRK